MSQVAAILLDIKSLIYFFPVLLAQTSGGLCQHNTPSMDFFSATLQCTRECNVNTYSFTYSPVLQSALIDLNTFFLLCYSILLRPVQNSLKGWSHSLFFPFVFYSKNNSSCLPYNLHNQTNTFEFPLFLFYLFSSFYIINLAQVLLQMPFLMQPTLNHLSLGLLFSVQ